MWYHSAIWTSEWWDAVQATIRSSSPSGLSTKGADVCIPKYLRLAISARSLAHWAVLSQAWLPVTFSKNQCQTDDIMSNTPTCCWPGFSLRYSAIRLGIAIAICRMKCRSTASKGRESRVMEGASRVVKLGMEIERSRCKSQEAAT